MKNLLYILFLFLPLCGYGQSDDPRQTNSSYLEITREGEQKFLAPGTSGQYLQTNGTTLNWTAIQESDLPTRPATDVTVADAGGYFTGTTTEAATQELGQWKVDSLGIQRSISVTTTFDFPSTADGATSQLFLALTGASINDVVLLGLPATNNDAVIYKGYVSAADQVAINMINLTSSTLDLEDQTIRVTVLKRY